MIAPDLTALLEPLEMFETIRRRAVRLGDRLCDLSYANLYGGPPPSVRNALRESLERDEMLDLQYTPFGGLSTVRRAVADDLTARYQLAFGCDDVILTPGAMAGLHLAIQSIGRAGDEVVIPTPCWLDYPLYVEHLGRRAKLVTLKPPRFSLDVPAIAAAITARTCAILLSHPSNPTGRCYDQESLQALAAALRDIEDRTGRQITIIADESHRDFTRATQYFGVATEWPNTLIVYSFGKYHFLQGQRCGYLAVSPEHPTRRDVANDALRWSRIMGFCTPTALMQRTVPALLNLEHDMRDIACSQHRAAAVLTAAGYQVVPPDGTLFLYVATPHNADDFAFASRLASAGVLMLPAPLFHHRGYFRVSLMGGQDIVERGIATLQQMGAT